MQRIPGEKVSNIVLPVINGGMFELNSLMQLTNYVTTCNLSFGSIIA